MKKKLLFLEDDPLLGETVYEDLQEAGFDVEWVKSADEAADLTFENRYDLYLFDVNVPGMSGFDLLSSLRQSGDDTPCVFLTARSEVSDLKEGFVSGADDYVTKPFDMQTLLIRIEAKIKDERVIVSQTLLLDREQYALVVDGKTCELPKKEFEILEYFISNKKRIVSKDEILSQLYEDEFISDSTFRVYIKHLNTHLEGHAKLVNIRGVGYRFEIV
jgi:DNA-binding response OmpR family regulator